MVPVFSPWKNNWQKIIENLIKIFNWYVVIEVVESCHTCRLSSTYLKRGPYPNERNFTWFIFLHRLNRNYNCFQQQKGFEKKLLNRDLINYPPRPHLQHLSSYVYLFAFFQKEVLKNIIIFINENKTHSWNKTKGTNFIDILKLLTRNKHTTEMIWNPKLRLLMLAYTYYKY